MSKLEVSSGLFIYDNDSRDKMFTPLFLSLYFVKQVLVRRPFVVLVLKLGPCRVEVPCKRIGDLVWYDEEALNETEDTLTTP